MNYVQLRNFIILIRIKSYILVQGQGLSSGVHADRLNCFERKLIVINQQRQIYRHFQLIKLKKLLIYYYCMQNVFPENVLFINQSKT